MDKAFEFFMGNSAQLLWTVFIIIFIITAFISRRTLNQMVEHTLKNPKTGMWSRKNLTGFACIFYAMFYSTAGMVREKVVQEFVVAIFVGAGLTCLGISSWEKVQLKNKEDTTTTDPD